MDAELGVTGLALTSLKLAQEVKRKQESLPPEEQSAHWKRDLAQTYATLALVKAVRQLTEELGV